jgi:hypothetical protein
MGQGKKTASRLRKGSWASRVAHGKEKEERKKWAGLRKK